MAVSSSPRNSLGANALNRFVELVRKAAFPAIWSEGSTLAKSASFLLERKTTDEIFLRVVVTGKPVHPRVSLWPSEDDWYCDCGDRHDPCIHVCGAAVYLKQNKDAQPVAASPTQADRTTGSDAAGSKPGLKTSSLDKSAASNKKVLRLRYRFSRENNALSVTRLISASGPEADRRSTPIADRELRESLTSLVGGIQTGRTKLPPIAASQADFAIDKLFSSPNYPARGPIPRQYIVPLFKALSQSGSIDDLTLDAIAIRISPDPLRFAVEVVDDGRGFRIRRAESFADSAPASETSLWGDRGEPSEVFRNGVIRFGNILRPLEIPALTQEEQPCLTEEGLIFSEKDRARVTAEVIPALQKKLAVLVRTSRLPQLVHIKPRIRIEIEAEGPGILSVLPTLAYGEPPIAEVHADGLIQISETEFPDRDPAAEKSLLRELQDELQLAPGHRIQVKGSEAVRFQKRIEAWTQKTGNSVFGSGRTRFALRGELEAELDASNDSLSLRFKLGEAEVSAESVLEAWNEHESVIEIPGGGYASLPEAWLDKYAKRIEALLAAQQMEALKRKQLKLPSYRLPELIGLCEETKTAFPDSLEKLRTTLENFVSIPDAPLPKDLAADLRSYQHAGVNWLCFLRDLGMGALLADDMGLGKTLQAMCAIQGRSLVVVPTSVLTTWAEQLERFRPGLKFSIYRGTDRALNPDAEITLTSYGILRLDKDTLNKESWDTVVLDEAQTIKNPESQIAQAAHSLRAKFRLALSGTPVENRLTDLWSQFEFLNPGIFGSLTRFEEDFADPIQGGNADATRLLRERIKPFILRRLKIEVAPELPPRTEVVLRCELDEQEREIYQSLLLSTRKEVLDRLDQSGGVFAALELLLRLRQACCHTGLLPGEDRTTSSKVSLLVDTLKNSIEGGHRALVFSQWTSLLDRIQPELDQAGIKYLRLDGSTRDRGALVTQFQADDGPPVMLLSLKAGGVGLTLTAADHIFIMDPWWNPAVEDQAADRAHRIGQDQPVLIHRLVAEGTVEERILELQKRKQALARAALDGAQASDGLTRDDLMALLG